MPGTKRGKKFLGMRIKSKAKDLIGIKESPLFSMLSPVHFEIIGNKEVIIEGCKCILQYDENIVRISVKNMSVSFYGRNLLIKCLTEDSLIVNGFITSIEFST